MSSQSFTTPATFMVSADVFPTSRNTARLSANAHSEFVPNTNTLGRTATAAAARSLGSSTKYHGTVRNTRQHGAM
uniref:Uncharacterized protein n=1 Tax=Oryza brachyantha TaxID=4533 RepID=J3NB88_ORYBR